MSTDDLPDLTEGTKTVTYHLGHYFTVFILIVRQWILSQIAERCTA